MTVIVMARKKIEIDGEKVRILASFGCTYLDIGKYYQCGESTIRRRFKAEFESGQEELKLNLRINLLKIALEHDNTAANIFLAKNFLGMSDKTAIDLTGNIESVLKECGFEDNPIDQTNTESREAMEALGLSADSTPAGHS